MVQYCIQSYSSFTEAYKIPPQIAALEIDNFPTDRRISGIIGKIIIRPLTRIRKALEDGRIQEARNLLGYWHKIYGEIIHGDHRGRELGYPTANIELHGILIPRLGIYSSIVEISFAGLEVDCIMNISSPRTFS